MMKRFLIHIIHLQVVVLLMLSIAFCSKKDDPKPDVGPDTTQKPVVVDYDPNIADDYASIAGKEFSNQWGSYNLHDPSIIKSGDYYYIYSTDVAYGPNGQCGIMYRKSKDLVKWQFLGWIFNGVPAKPFSFMQANQSTYKALGIWAPYIIKVGDTYRLYYSVPGNDIKLACIALATSTSPTGPWTDEGIVVSCLPSDNFNAIDPAVITDQNTGQMFMSYGSYSAGIFIIELDPSTGKAMITGDKGSLLAYRKKMHDAIEGGEILYNPEQKMYYLFVSYDWLEDTYNVRVGRSDKAIGPYYDINGNNMAAVGDNLPMITAQYKFDNHAGWQGMGHCGLLNDNGEYYYVSQARLASNKYFMDLHIHRMLWTPSGWPVVSPERYVKVPQDTIKASKLIGKWEHIDLVKTANSNVSVKIELKEDGSVVGLNSATWSFANNLLTITIESVVYEVRVSTEWDWENKKITLVYTGMNGKGYCIWGKKI